MKKRAAIIFFGTVFAILVATIAVLQSRPFERWAKDQVQSQARAELHSEVRIGDPSNPKDPGLQIHLIAFPPHVDLYDIEITPLLPGDPNHFTEPTIRVDHARADLHPLQLLASKVHVDEVELDHPHVDLEVRDGKLYGLPTPLIEGGGDAATAPGATDSPIRIDVISVKNGTFHFTSDDPKVQLGLTHVRALATIEPNGAVDVNLESTGRRIAMRLKDADLDEEITDLGGELVIKGSTLEIKNGRLTAGPITLGATGTIALSGGTDVQLAMAKANAPLEYVNRIDENIPPMQGLVDWTGTLSIKGKNVRALGLAKIPDFWLTRFHLGDTEAEIEMAGSKAHARRVTIRQGTGTIEGVADLSWANDDLRLGADVGLTNVSFGRVLQSIGITDSEDKGAHVDALLDGRVAFEGPLDPMSLTGTAKLTHRDFTWRDIPFDDPKVIRPNVRVPAGRLNASFNLKDDGLWYKDVDATAGESTLVGQGNLIWREPASVELTFACAPLDLGGLSPLGSVPVTGKGPASGRLYGPIDHLVLEGDVDLDGTRIADFDFGRGAGPLKFDQLVLSSKKTVFTRGQTTYQGGWTFDFNDPMSLAFDVETRNGRIEDLSDILWRDIPHGPASRFVQGEVTGQMALSGPLDALSGSYSVSTAKVVIRGTSGSVVQRFDRLTSSGRWDKGTIWTDNLLATNHSGAQIYARGSLAPEIRPGWGGPVNVELHTSRFKLADLDTVGPESSLASDLGLRMHIGGTFFQPELKGRLDLTGTSFHGSLIGASQVNFDTVPGKDPAVRDQLQLVANAAGGSIQATAGVTLAGDLPFEAEIAATRHSIKPYLWVFNPHLPKEDDVSAFASGTVTLKGWVYEPEKTEFVVKANDVQLAKGPHALSNHEPIEFSFGNGNVAVKDFSLKGDETHFHLHGSQTADGKIDFEGDGDVDLAFAELITDVFTRAEGVLHLRSLAIRGSAADPQIRGVADVEGGVFKTRFFPLGMEEVRGHLDFSEKEVDFVRPITGKVGGGSFEGWGRLLLSGMAVSYWDLHAKLFDSTVRFSSHSLSARGSGELAFTGPSSSPDLTGDLTIADARYSEPVDWKAQAVTFNPHRVAVAAPDEASKLFNLQIVMRSDGNLWMKNDLVNAEWKIRKDDPLVLEGNNAEWGLKGTLEALRGKATFQGREFAITSGTVTFVSPREVDFLFDVTAETLIRDWQITANATGRYSGAKYFSYDSNPPLPKEDITSLLLAGVRKEEVTGTGQDAALAAGVLASVAGQGLFEQRGLASKVKSVIQLDAFEMVPTYNQGQVGFKAVGRKAINPDLSVTASVGHAAQMTTWNAQADYRLNSRVHLVGGWNNEPDNTDPGKSVLGSQGDVSVDAKFRFEWK